jgi:hypothetical protein
MDDTVRPVSGNECQRITEAASASRNAFSALFRGSKTCPSFIPLCPSSAPGAVRAIVSSPNAKESGFALPPTTSAAPSDMGCWLWQGYAAAVTVARVATSLCRIPGRGAHPKRPGRPGGPGGRRDIIRVRHAPGAVVRAACWRACGCGPGWGSSRRQITYSSGASRASLKRRAYTPSTRAALVAKSGSRGKIQDRCCQGLIASAQSQRQIVVSEMEAKMPCSTAARARSGQCQRASGTPAVVGSSQASALPATTTSGGNSGPSSPGLIGQSGQALLVEAFAPLGHHLPRGV